MVEQFAALGKGVEPSRLPCAEETGEGHAGLGAAGALAAATDRARDDQGPQTPLGVVVARADPGRAHERAQFAVLAQQAMRQQLVGETQNLAGRA